MDTLPFTKQVFNATVSGTTPVLSDPRYNELLGQAEVLVVQVVASRVEGITPTLTVELYDSCNGEQWLFNTLLLNLEALLDTQNNVFSLSTGTNTAFLARVRVKLTLGGTDPVANLTVTVGGRNNPML